MLKPSLRLLRTLVRTLMNRLLRPFGIQVISTTSYTHHGAVAVECERLRRDLRLLAVCEARASLRTGFESAWRAFLLAHLNHPHSLSENAQDLFAWFCTDAARSGYFVEVGAFDGLRMSNTFLLERHGWTGLLIEPVRSHWARCRAARTAESVHGAVVAAPLVDHGPTTTVINAGLQSSLSLNFWGKESAKADLALHDIGLRRSALARGATEKTPTLRLSDEIRARTAHVDFLSIDIEGGEAEILAELRFDLINVRTCCIEHNWRHEDMRAISDRMTVCGFVRVLEAYSGRDYWFVAREIFERLSAQAWT